MIEDILLLYPFHVHVGIVVIATIIWFVRKVPQNSKTVIADIFSFLSIFVMYFLVYTYTNKTVNFGSRAGWYIFYSILTTGLLPLFTLLVPFFLAAASVGFCVQSAINFHKL